MASLQDIRRRIKSVKSIQQITKAMKMVAAARLRRAQQAATQNRPYVEKMTQVVRNVSLNAKDFQHPLLNEYQEGKELYLIIASDKGLAGAYASNVFKCASSYIKDKDTVDLIALGKKTLEHFKARDYNIVDQYIGISERPRFEDAKKIAKSIIALYESGKYQSVKLIYTRFVSAINSVPERISLLPFTELQNTKDMKVDTDYIFEPSAAQVLNILLPEYLVTVIYAAELQAAASELSSRMAAMSSATDNAQELIKNLDLHYNKVRQANITREISEIVGGAEALK